MDKLDPGSTRRTDVVMKQSLAGATDRRAKEKHWTLTRITPQFADKQIYGIVIIMARLERQQ